MRRFPLVLLAVALLGTAARTPIPVVSKDPYLGALAIDADTGDVLFADRADEKGYPASMLKLMDLLLILEYVEQGKLRYTDPIRVTAEAATMGGSQVFLEKHEVFSLEEMLYALMVQSANDAAAALAIHIAGSRDGFVSLMNQRAQQLGMTATHFASVHGLPPTDGAPPDVTTARDFTRLCRELMKHPDALKFTSTVRRPFRPNAPEPFIMDNHNNLLGEVDGCDGFKTGYFEAAGFSIAATAKRNDRRVICVVMGSKDRKVRDERAAAILARSFLVLPPKPVPPPPPPAVTNLPPPVPVAEPPPASSEILPWVLGLAAVAGAAAVGFFLLRPRRRGDVVRRPPM